MSFFERMMRNAAPILFWSAVLIFIGGLATSLLVDRQIVSGSIINPDSFLRGIVTGLNAAVWPFTGAGLIWTLQKRGGGGG